MRKIYIVYLLLLMCGCKKETAQQQAGICISFDDRSILEWYEIRPLLNKYQAKVTFFINDFETLDSSQISMLKILKEEGHEIGSHGRMHAASNQYIKEHSYTEYLAKEIDYNTEIMNIKGFPPTSFAYPFGTKYWFTDYLLLKRFEVLRGVSTLNEGQQLEDLDAVYYDFDGSRIVSAIGIDKTTYVLTEEMISKGLKRAKDKREVLMFYGHVPADTNNHSVYAFNIQTLEYILNESQKNHLKYYTITELVQ